jgi:hypothetical protein
MGDIGSPMVGLTVIGLILIAAIVGFALKKF